MHEYYQTEDRLELEEQRENEQIAIRRAREREIKGLIGKIGDAHGLLVVIQDRIERQDYYAAMRIVFQMIPVLAGMTDTLTDIVEDKATE